MNRRPRRAAHVFVSTLAAGALLTTAGCSEDGNGGGSSQAVSSPSAEVSASPLVQESPTGSTAPALTTAQAQTALLTNTDLGSQWTQSKAAETWRATMVKGKTNVAECQKLLDALVAGELLGGPSGSRAVTGFADSDNDAQMRYEVAAYDHTTLDKSFDWLKSVPVTCDQFTATGTPTGTQTVQVIETSLPDAGDDRQGLQMTTTGALEGTPFTLTMDIAAVRVGDNAVSLTNGGLGGADSDSTNQAVQLGTQRLTDVLAGKTPAEQPPGQQD
ncbi:hypothetical protein AB0D78_37935 [Streptomyces avermitilis]|uniref:hypothetical protein n=1 Tax=Streptomyces avermitilis TaxID=33903 RepID=UPI0033DFE968